MAPPPPIAPEQWQRYRAARRSEEQGDPAAAVATLRALVFDQPRFIAAHRALQNLELAAHRRGALLATYRALRDAAPRSAERWYLWGRIQSDPESQRAAFERARSLDPGCPWPLLGLGALLLAEGQPAAALRSCEEARALAPDEPDLELGVLRALAADFVRCGEAEKLLASELVAAEWDAERVLLIVDCRERSGRRREAFELLGQLLARQPWQREAARRLRVRLDAGVALAEVEWLAHALGAVADEPLVAELLARCHAQRGAVDEALAAWDAVPPIDAATRARRRLLLVQVGAVERALALEAPRFAALEELGAPAPAYARACRLAADRAAGGARGAVELARALVELGFDEEALVLLRPWRRAASPEIAALRGRLLAQRQLEAEFKVQALATYGAAEEERPDFDRFVATLDALAQRIDPTAAAEPARRLSFWPLGELLDPTGPGLPRWFADGGRLLVAGQRRGQPPELFMAPVLARGVAGPQRAALSWIEGTAIPGWLEHQGARFAGAALDRFVWIDVGVVEDEAARLLAFEQRIGARSAELLADPVERAATAAERCRIAEPAEVAAKLDLRALADCRARAASDVEQALRVDALDAVLQHEAAHLEDAARFLPFSRKVWGQLPRLLALRFSPRRIEEWLELRAQVAALARAKNPFLVLSECAGQLAGRDGLTPHADGYRELLARLVALIDAAPAAFPSIDRGKVILQQLDLLSRAELQRAAERLAAELEIPLAPR